jgi:2-keto-3-deoxy-6-phosphogluconate aldolase
MSRTDVVRAIEQSGVVAVIRLKDAGKLRHVVDALIEGGVTAPWA